jgi:hypothetical protein
MLGAVLAVRFWTAAPPFALRVRDRSGSEIKGREKDFPLLTKGDEGGLDIFFKALK